MIRSVRYQSTGLRNLGNLRRASPMDATLWDSLGTLVILFDFVASLIAWSIIKAVIGIRFRG